MDAKDMYVKCMEAPGYPVHLVESGLHLYPTATYLGASSDGLLFDSTLEDCTMGCLEVKCPFSIGGMSVVN